MAQLFRFLLWPGQEGAWTEWIGRSSYHYYHSADSMAQRSNTALTATHTGWVSKPVADSTPSGWTTFDPRLSTFFPLSSFWSFFFPRRPTTGTSKPSNFRMH